MPRTALTKTAAPGGYYGAGVALTMTGADVGNMNSVAASGNDLIVAQNTDSGAHNITITSVVDQYNRLGSITSESIAAGAIRIYGPFKRDGWMQTDGNVYLQADSALVKFGVITLP
jgi:hypothetical protein